MKNDEMILRICEDKSIRLEFFENGQKRTKVISVETLTDCIRRSLAGVRLTTGLLPANALSVTMDSDNERRYAVLEFPDERARSEEHTSELQSPNASRMPSSA